MTGFYSYTVVLTYMGLASAALGMILTAQGLAKYALPCLAFSGLCDTLDGKVTRIKPNHTEDEKHFGIQVDSLCNVVCFGAFPMILCYSMGMREIVGVCIPVFYFAVGVIRLAFFNVMEEHRQDETDEAHKYYRGLPVTLISIVLPLFYTLRPLLGYRFLSELHICILTVGLLFIINFQLREPGRKLFLFFIALVAVALIKIYSFQGSPSMIPLSLYQSRERCGPIKYADRSGHIYGRENIQGKLPRTFYNSLPGCPILRPPVRPCISRIGEYFLDLPLSAFLIRSFARSSGISLRGCETPAGGAYRSFSAFFTRSLKETTGPFSQDPDILCSPCGGLVGAYLINRKQHLSIKHTDYAMSQFLKDDKLASRYTGGTALVFHLIVSSYHRYAYIDNGLRSSYRRMPGMLHTANPATAVCRSVYRGDTREYSLLRSRGLETVLMMEVGAMIVGKIVSHHKAYTRLDVFHGQGKEYFVSSGSTVTPPSEPGQATVDEDILRNTVLDIETKVKMGEAIGRYP